jgi:predicted nucleic acid-binding protein
MQTMFLDTNIIIRYLTNDDPDRAAIARTILKAAEQGQVVLVTSESVLVEVVQVLSSARLYNLSRERVATALLAVLALRGLKLPHKRTYRRALSLWQSHHVDFVDALSVAQMERRKITTIASFDQDFDSLEGITRWSEKLASPDG